MIEVTSALERAGYIERTPSPKHRRVLESRLTQRGRSKLAACDRAVDEMEDEMLAGVPEAERIVLTEWLVGCVRALHAGFAERDADLTGLAGN